MNRTFCLKFDCFCLCLNDPLVVLLNKKIHFFAIKFTKIIVHNDKIKQIYVCILFVQFVFFLFLLFMGIIEIPTCHQSLAHRERYAKYTLYVKHVQYYEVMDIIQMAYVGLPR